MTDIWQLSNPSELEAEQFRNLDHVLGVEGEQINTSDMSTLVRVKVGESKYYIKKYHRGGRHFRRRLGRLGRAFLISGSVGARPPPLRGSGPLD